MAKLNACADTVRPFCDDCVVDKINGQMVLLSPAGGGIPRLAGSIGEKSNSVRHLGILSHSSGGACGQGLSGHSCQGPPSGGP